MTSTLLYHVKQLRKHGGFQKQFNKLPSGLLHDCYAAMEKENRLKNIYNDVFAYDQTRVVLELNEDHSPSDYINASFVSGVDAPNKFVASQGPMNRTVGDFWLMIFQLRTSMQN
ncbi:receptor-type tyrosine-protein phosphatase alpha-like [Haliotis rubra]|uniref:receptor-type tyrosine-protein phosphatase alpha-like n=1 Tax=Haliotis rubra TaxID=36100 RepID=UPI001EE629FA|nr:receptor-type tyrosine-protein phosphatase alpha-like [Haliotis rubra]